MSSITSFAEAHTVLNRFIPPLGSNQRAYTLERMQKLMPHLGNPQEQYKVIHVAGTSGKTSTAHYLASFLQAGSQNVGLTVSPHVDEINERVQIGLIPLEEKEFCELLDQFLILIESSKLQPTYFEVLTAFAYWVFAQKRVDFAVVEVGMGGLLDGTNIIHNPEKICVITDIGLDHTDVLGKDLVAITAQKAGIIKPYNTVFMYDQGDEVMQVVREVCDQAQAELHEVWPLSGGELPRNLPLFQRRNWYLAWSVYQYLVQNHQLPELDEAQLSLTTETYIPARMEIMKRKGKTIILDGAHNDQKLHTLTKSIKKQFPKTPVAVLMGMTEKKGAQIKSSVEAITELASHIIFTSQPVEPGLPKQAANPSKLAEHCHKLGFDEWEIVEDTKKAYKALLNRPEEVLVITGSFYLLGHIRKQIGIIHK